MKGVMKEVNAPDPYEMDPHTRPTKLLLELCRLFSCLWVIWVDGMVKAIGSIVMYL